MTPMQELIENLEVFIGQGMSYSEWKKLKYGGKTSIQKYLEKEKEVIEKAWWAGCDEGASDHKIYPSEDCNGYYNETFNNKEK